MKQLISLTRFVLTTIFLFCIFYGDAQMTPYTAPVKKNTDNAREGFYGGVSVGYFHYTTHWYAYPDYYYIHSTGRTVVSASLERKGLWEAGPFQFDLGGELLLGLAGHTKDDYFGGDNTISTGGSGIGIQAFGRAVYVPEVQAGAVRVCPFVSVGPQYMMLYNNGKGSSDVIRSEGYDGGWDDFVTLMTAAVGAELQIEKVCLTPELRFNLFGWNSSSWTPHGHDAGMNGGPGFVAFSVRVSKKF